MENAGSSDLRGQIAQIASQFRLFECVQCSHSIQDFLTQLGISGKRVKLDTGTAKGTYGNIYHDGLQRNISTNGKHEGIITSIDGQELVFDNIYPLGVNKTEWLSSFYCLAIELGGEFQIEEIDF
jgi:Papain fold toxin 2